MSASREKKERRANPAQGPSERKKLEQKEAERRRVRTILYSIVGVVCVGLVAALLIWNSGIVQRNTTALTVGDVQYKPADVSYYFYQTLNNAWYYDEQMEYIYKQSGMEYTRSFDPAVSLHEQWTDEEKTETVYESFLNSSKDALRQVTALSSAADAAGFTLSDEDRAEMEETFASLRTNASSAGYAVEAYLKAIYGRYMTESIYLRHLEMTTLAEAFYTAETEKFADYSAEELEAYYGENSRWLDNYTYQYAYISGEVADPLDENGDPLTDEEGNTITATDEEKEAVMAVARANAEKMAEEVRGGGIFAELAPEYVDPTEQLAYLQTGYTSRENLGNDLKNAYFGDWLTDPERTEGDVDMFEGSSGFYVIQFEGRSRNDAPTQDFRHILFTAEKNEDGSDPGEPAMNTARDKADGVLRAYLAGDRVAERFADMADRLSEDSGSNTKGGLYEKAKRGDMVAGIDEWIFDPARAEGDVELIENNGPGYFGWHVVYYVGKQEPAWIGVAQSEKSTADTTAWVESVEAGFDVVDGEGLKYVN